MNTYTTVPSGEQVVQELPWRWKVQGRIFLIGGLGFMFDAWDVTLNGILIPLLSKHWSLSPGDAAWIGTATTTRGNFPAACSSGCRSRARWLCAPPFCSWTNRLPHSMP